MLENLRIEREKALDHTRCRALSCCLDTTGDRSADDAWAFITQHFGDLYSVKENVTELRKTILQLAVRGKLSDQTDEDGSATETLAKVASERRRLKIQSHPIPIRDTQTVRDPWTLGWHCLGDLLVSGPTNGFSPGQLTMRLQCVHSAQCDNFGCVQKAEHAGYRGRNFV